MGGSPPVIVKTCTQCRGTQKEPLFWAVANWDRADGVRIAYKHKLCLTCVAERIAPLQVHSDEQGMTCPSCGIDTSEDYDAVWITWIPKGVGELKAECPFCNACAARFRIWFEIGAEALPDREPSSRGMNHASGYSAEQTLRALGIQPRA